jgi:hypothetical protein
LFWLKENRERGQKASSPSDYLLRRDVLEEDFGWFFAIHGQSQESAFSSRRVTSPTVTRSTLSYFSVDFRGGLL